MGNKSKKLPIKGYKDYATRRNSEVFWYNYNKLKMKAISMFEWINLPPEIDARYLELMLCERGYVCFFKDDPTSDRKSLNNSIEEYGVYMALQCTLSGYFNIYNIPKGSYIRPFCIFILRHLIRIYLVIKNLTVVIENKVVDNLIVSIGEIQLADLFNCFFNSKFSNDLILFYA